MYLKFKWVISCVTQNGAMHFGIVHCFTIASLDEGVTRDVANSKFMLWKTKEKIVIKWISQDYSATPKQLWFNNTKFRYAFDGTSFFAITNICQQEQPWIYMMQHI